METIIFHLTIVAERGVVFSASFIAKLAIHPEQPNFLKFCQTFHSSEFVI